MPAASAFRRLSLGAKLSLGFGTVLALLVATGAVAITQLRAVESSAKQLYRVNLATDEKAGNLRRDALLERAGILGYVLEPNPALRRKAHAKLMSLQTAIGRDLGDLRAQNGLTVGQRSLLDEVAQSLDTWYAARDKGPLGLTDAGDHAGATKAALHGKGGHAFEAAFAATVRFSKITEADAAAEHARAVSTASSATTLMIALIALATAVGVGIAVFLTIRIRGAVRPVLDRLQMLRDRCATDLRTALEAMAEGDLTIEVTPVTPPIEKIGGDELGQIAEAVNGIRESTIASVAAYNHTRESLSGLVGRVSATSSALSAASQEMAATSEETGRAVNEIAQAVTDVASGAERQVEMVERARSSSEQTGAAVEQANAVAQQGVAAAEQANESMQALRESTSLVTDAIRTLAAKSEQIGGIVETITNIAGQTNLLALNAAIEAARAGEQGRGFAVVAEEVRKLAEESQTAAASIASLIGEIQSETERTVEIVEDSSGRAEESSATVAAARQAFQEIGTSVDGIRAQIAQIVEATGEVAAVAEQSSSSTEEVSASTEETSASAQQIAASAQQLAGTAEQLNQLVAEFTLAT
jgi:methyl-accepting chemotaxis protein